MTQETCKTCQFWRIGWRREDGTIIMQALAWGDCRRHPPVRVEDGSIDVFPRSHQNDWCGEHQPKEPRA